MKEIENLLLSCAASKQWKSIEIKDHHGINIPLFALHTEKSAGIGEFLDLLPLIEWCKKVGLDVIQLLPLNDTGLGTSPYSAISAYALSPLYISLHALPEIEKIDKYKEKITKIRYWNKTLRVKYHIVRELKQSILKEYFDLVFPKISYSKEYLAFIADHPWLKSYAIFRAFKEKELWQDWESWPEEYKNPTASFLNQNYEQLKSQCDFTIFNQFLCYKQMGEVKEFATKHHVMIKGDLPILISRDSADVWASPEYFTMDYAVGAPPDRYSKTGQYWGFPSYNWDALAKTNYAWWKERLKLAAHLYHLYRIDHIVGFYRLWAIPRGKKAIEGAFIPEEEATQKVLGNQLMRMMLESAPILPIGEDLGIVPNWVRESMYTLGICGTKLMRWERHWELENHPYIDPKEYPPLTMTTVSSHDSDTLTLWWRHAPLEARAYCNFKGWDYKPFLTPERLKSILYDSHHSSSLFHINLFQEYLACFPELVSPNPNEERINVPGKISDYNWTYRLHQNLEHILEHKGLRELFKELLT